PDVAAAVADGMRRHQQGAVGLGRQLAAVGALASGTGPEQAATAFAMMTSPASWRQLTHHSGWTFEDAEQWLTTALSKLLLASSQ
ncbi:MAG: hypothetical protein ACRDU4_05325, partial [Mycobacterium sp.]